MTAHRSCATLWLTDWVSLRENRMPRILLVEDESDLARLVRELLIDEGYDVVVVPDPRLTAVQAAVERNEPACVLLDGVGHTGYGEAWEVAAWLHQRPRPVPT